MSHATDLKQLRKVFLYVPLVFGLVQPVSADSIIYVFTGNITGTLGGTTLTNAPFAWHAEGKSKTITSPAAQHYVNAGLTNSSITITTSSGMIVANTAGVTDPVTVAIDPTLGITMANATGTFSMQFPNPNGVGSPLGYLLDAAGGPINAGAGGTFVSTSPLNTSSGPLNITALANLTFQAFVDNGQQIISRIADGGAWHTGFVGTNTTFGPLSGSLACAQDIAGGGGATQPWQLPLASGSLPRSFVLPPGGTLFLATTGAAASTSTGWCQYNGDPGLNLYAIFTQSVTGRPDQDVTSPAQTQDQNALIPFDDTTGLVSTAAVVNPTNSPIVISPYIRINPSGTVSAGTPFTLPANGHMAFTLPSQFSVTAGAQGLLDLYTAGGAITALALRFNQSGGIAGGQVTIQSGSDVFGQ
jgi:hypothetical protein